LVGGLAVSVRAEVRFTRDVDIAVAVADDAEAESLTYELRLAGYTAVASVENRGDLDSGKVVARGRNYTWTTGFTVPIEVRVA
jgi:hypothetical protein